MVQPPAEMVIPQPGSKMAKYKTSLCKHFEQTGTCQMDSRCHFAHGKHELRKQTEVSTTPPFKKKFSLCFYYRRYPPMSSSCTRHQ